MSGVEPWVQLWDLIIWLGFLKILQLAVYPYLKKPLGRYAYPAGYPVSLLLLTLVSWYCGRFHIPVQVAVLPFLALVIVSSLRKARSFEGIKREIFWDGPFIGGFFFALALRFTTPVISYFSEQFLNHAFIATVMRYPVAPPIDPWFSGGVINVYYYLGHWLMGVIGIITGTPSSVVFNLALPTVAGISFVMIYAVGDLFLPRFRWLPLVTFFLVPPAVLLYTLQGDHLYTVLDKSVWTIANTRTEYPLFTMLLGDTHAFTLGWFNQCLFLFLMGYCLLYWHKTGKYGRLLLIGMSILSLGSMPPMNTWDVLIYGPLLVVTALILVVREWRETRRVAYETLAFLAGVPVGAVLIYLPYYLELRSAGVNGLGLVSTPSTFQEFLLFLGFFALFFLIAVLPDIRKEPVWLLGALPFLAVGYIPAAVTVIPLIYLIKRWSGRYEEILAIFGLLVIIICEFIHFEEALSGVAERWNTVYKLYATVWILLSLSACLMLGRWLSSRPWIWTPSKRLTRVITLVVILLLILTPLFARIDIGKGLLGISYANGYDTLDGLAYLDSYEPGDAAAIRYLSGLPGNFVVVEGFTGDYDYYSRISSLTGIQTILGRRNGHEFLYRGDVDGWYWYRPRDIQTIYENPKESLDVMRKYNATMVYVGDREREVYNVSLPLGQLDLVFDKNGSQVYRVRG